MSCSKMGLWVALSLDLQEQCSKQTVWHPQQSLQKQICMKAWHLSCWVDQVLVVSYPVEKPVKWYPHGSQQLSVGSSPHHLRYPQGWITSCFLSTDWPKQPAPPWISKNSSFTAYSGLLFTQEGLKHYTLRLNTSWKWTLISQKVIRSF